MIFGTSQFLRQDPAPYSSHTSCAVYLPTVSNDSIRSAPQPFLTGGQFCRESMLVYLEGCSASIGGPNMTSNRREQVSLVQSKMETRTQTASPPGVKKILDLVKSDMALDMRVKNLLDRIFSENENILRKIIRREYSEFSQKTNP